MSDGEGRLAVALLLASPSLPARCGGNRFLAVCLRQCEQEKRGWDKVEACR